MESSARSKQLVDKSQKADRAVLRFREAYNRSLDNIDAIILVSTQENNLFASARRDSAPSESREKMLIQLSGKRETHLQGIRTELACMEQCAEELRSLQTDTSAFHDDPHVKAFQNISESANIFSDGLLKCRRILRKYTDSGSDSGSDSDSDSDSDLDMGLKSNSKMTDQEFKQAWQSAMREYEEQNKNVDDALAELLGAMSSSSSSKRNPSIVPDTPQNSYVNPSMSSFQQRPLGPLPDLDSDDDEEMMS